MRWSRSLIGGREGLGSRTVRIRWSIGIRILRMCGTSDVRMLDTDDTTGGYAAEVEANEQGQVQTGCR